MKEVTNDKTGISEWVGTGYLTGKTDFSQCEIKKFTPSKRKTRTHIVLMKILGTSKFKLVNCTKPLVKAKNMGYRLREQVGVVGVVSYHKKDGLAEVMNSFGDVTKDWKLLNAEQVEKLLADIQVKTAGSTICEELASTLINGLTLEIYDKSTGEHFVAAL